MSGHQERETLRVSMNTWNAHRLNLYANDRFSARFVQKIPSSSLIIEKYPR